MSEFITNAELRIEAERLCDENDQLREENAKLREQVTQLREERDLYRELFNLTTQPDRYVQVGDENAKLRELVRDMWEGYNDPRCEECHLKDTPTCADCPICAREALVIDRMRELGIEVSDDNL